MEYEGMQESMQVSLREYDEIVSKINSKEAFVKIYGTCVSPASLII